MTPLSIYAIISALSTLAFIWFGTKVASGRRNFRDSVKRQQDLEG